MARRVQHWGRVWQEFGKDFWWRPRMMSIKGKNGTSAKRTARETWALQTYRYSFWPKLELMLSDESCSFVSNLPHLVTVALLLERNLCLLRNVPWAKADAQSSGALCRGSGQSKQPRAWISFPSLHTVFKSLVSPKRVTGRQHYFLTFGVKVEMLY